MRERDEIENRHERENPDPLRHLRPQEWGGEGKFGLEGGHWSTGISGCGWEGGHGGFGEDDLGVGGRVGTGGFGENLELLFKSFPNFKSLPLSTHFSSSLSSLCRWT
ncbi:hypothetical protein ACFX14_008128 [Malus domestica]